MDNISSVTRSVAVVIPVYNGAAFIGDAIESVFVQSYPISELIVIDDGSTDNTLEIVEKYAHKGVRCLQQERLGPSAARNRGIAETQAELIAFLDADDVWMPDKIRKQVEYLVAHPDCGFVSCDTIWFNPEQNIRRIIRRSVKPGVDQRHEIAVQNFVGNTSHVIIWRHVLDRIGAFDNHLRWCEDWELWTRLINWQPFSFVSEPLVIYQWHSNSNAHQRRWERSHVVFEVARRAVSRVQPLWMRPFLLARVNSIVHSQRAHYAIKHDLPRTLRMKLAFQALAYAPFEKTTKKLGYCVQALLGKDSYQVLKQSLRFAKKRAKNTQSDQGKIAPATSLRVLHLLPAFSIGGAEMLVLSLAGSCTAEYISPHVCALFDRGKRELRPDLEKLGIPVECFNASHLYSPLLFKRLATYVKQHNIDVIHTHLLSADIAGRIVGALLGVPVLSTLHSVPQGFANNRPDRRWLERITALYLTDQLVTVAEHVRNQFVKEWHLKAEQIKVIYNAIPMERFLRISEQPLRAEWESSPVIMTIGRLIPDKAHDLLLEAAGIVLRKHPEAHFVIVGDGSERERLEGIIRSTGLEGHVTMTGMRRDVPELLAQCNIFVLSSHREGLPLSVVEAMAAARPVVVTDVGGNRELISHGEHGLIIPPGNSMLLASSLIEMIENPELCRAFGRAGRERVRYQFALELMIEEYEAIYLGLTQKKLKQAQAVEI